MRHIHKLSVQSMHQQTANKEKTFPVLKLSMEIFQITLFVCMRIFITNQITMFIGVHSTTVVIDFNFSLLLLAQYTPRVWNYYSFTSYRISGYAKLSLLSHEIKRKLELRVTTKSVPSVPAILAENFFHPRCRNILDLFHERASTVHRFTLSLKRHCLFFGYKE